MLFKKSELKPVFGEPPMAALRQPPNLKKMICMSKPYPKSRADKYSQTCHKNAPGWKKCGKGTTTCCPFALPPTTQVTGQVTGYTHQIRDSVNCETKNCNTNSTAEVKWWTNQVATTLINPDIANSTLLV